MLKCSKEERSVLSCYRGRIPGQTRKILSLSYSDILKFELFYLIATLQIFSYFITPSPKHLVGGGKTNQKYQKAVLLSLF